MSKISGGSGTLLASLAKHVHPMLGDFAVLNASSTIADPKYLRR